MYHDTRPVSAVSANSVNILHSQALYMCMKDKSDREQECINNYFGHLTKHVTTKVITKPPSLFSCARDSD